MALCHQQGDVGRASRLLSMLLGQLQGVKMKPDSDANSDSAAESNGEFWNLSGDERSIGGRTLFWTGSM